MAPQLAWIGLGNMGRGMSKNLVEKGKLTEPLILYNRTTSRAEALSEALGSGKTKVAKSIEEAVGPADIVFTCVGDDKAIKDTVDTILKNDVSGKLIVDCSTVHPDTTSALSKAITAKGARFVACPVFGAPAMAENGQLVCVLAGPASDVEKVKPYTTGVMGRADIDYSDQEVGRATLLKIIGNTFILQMCETLGQGHTMAEKTGLGVDNLHHFIETMFPGPFTAYSTRMRTGDYYNRDAPLFAVDLALKDAKHALDLASTSGGKVRSVELCRDHLLQVKDEQGEKGDIAGIYGAIRKENGLQFGNGNDR